jgi:citrate synthase
MSLAARVARTVSEGSIRSDYLSRRDALAILEVKPQTLYSYVSRGLIRKLTLYDSRMSCYNCEDVMWVKARSVARSGHGPVAAGAVHWGEPVLSTGITEITAAGPRYRNRLAIDLARTGCSFEAVAEYLWTADLPNVSVRWRADIPTEMYGSLLAQLKSLRRDVHIRELLSQIVLLLSISEEGQQSTTDIVTVNPARRLLLAMSGVFGLLGPDKKYAQNDGAEGLACGLAQALGIRPSQTNIRAINTALILVADHEFTPATFAARIGASVGNSLYACIGAALNVQFGSLFALSCNGVEQHLDPAAIINADETPAEMLPMYRHGFDHPLYPQGDPRAEVMLELALKVGSESGNGPSALKPLKDLGSRRARVTMDQALVLLCRAMGLAPQAADGLLAVGRAAGWVAHVIEQRRQGAIIRPRGRYINAEGG